MVHILGYARMRMDERGVSEADVDSALELEARPPRAANRPGRIIKCGFDTSGTLLEVVLNDHGEVVNVLRPRR